MNLPTALKHISKENADLKKENAELRAEVHKLKLGLVKLYREANCPILTDKIEVQNNVDIR